MKETEFRARFHKSRHHHESNCYIIERRTKGMFSKWEEVSRPIKQGDTNAEKELVDYMKIHLGIEPAKEDTAYARIKRL